MKLQCLVLSLALIVVSGKKNRRSRLLRVDPGTSTLEQIGGTTLQEKSSNRNAIEIKPAFDVAMGNTDADIQSAIEELFNDRFLQVSMSMSRTRKLETSSHHESGIQSATKQQHNDEQQPRSLIQTGSNIAASAASTSHFLSVAVCAVSFVTLMTSLV